MIALSFYKERGKHVVTGIAFQTRIALITEKILTNVMENWKRNRMLKTWLKQMSRTRTSKTHQNKLILVNIYVPNEFKYETDQ